MSNPKLKITRTIVWTSEVEYNDETYQNMTLREAIVLEHNYEDHEVAEFLTEALQFAEADDPNFQFSTSVEVIENAEEG